MMIRQKDMRSEPVRRVVSLGESHVDGMTASSPQMRWVNQTVKLLEEFQGQPIEFINKGISANVITTECPSYDSSAKPAALERLDADVIALKPDLLFVSYGLNDSRGGTPLDVFCRAFLELIDRVRARINPLIVAPNVYYMHEVCYRMYEPFTKSNYDLTEIFNLAIKQLCEANGLIYVDIYGGEVGCDWMIDDDHCHANDLGHRIIAHRVFEAIARNCSFVARKCPQGWRTSARG